MSSEDPIYKKKERTERKRTAKRLNRPITNGRPPSVDWVKKEVYHRLLLKGC